MVTVHVACCLRRAALASRMCCPSVERSLLSRSKKTGRNGEFRFNSSRDADDIASSRTGSGGTIDGSGTATGGAGGRVGAVSLAEAVAGGGGAVGRAIGAFLRPQAAAVSTTVITSAVTQTPPG